MERGNLAITRKIGERFKIGDDIDILIVDIKCTTVKVLISAPKSVPIVRDDAKRR